MQAEALVLLFDTTYTQRSAGFEAIGESLGSKVYIFVC